MTNDGWNYFMSFQVWKLVDRQVKIHVTDGLAVFIVLKIIHFNGLTNFCWHKCFKSCCRIPCWTLFWNNNDQLYILIYWPTKISDSFCTFRKNLRHFWELKDGGELVTASKCKQMSLNPFVNCFMTDRSCVQVCW